MTDLDEALMATLRHNVATDVINHVNDRIGWYFRDDLAARGIFGAEKQKFELRRRELTEWWTRLTRSFER